MEKKESKIRKEALKILAKKDVSEKYLKTKLLEKGFEFDEVEEEIEFLKKKGLIDDQRFFERLKEKYLENGKGFFYIKYHFENLGFDSELNISLKEEVETILKIIKAKKLKKSDLKDSKKKIKLMLFLSRRGFRQEAILNALNSFLGSQRK